MREGDTADNLYFVEEGELQVLKRVPGEGGHGVVNHTVGRRSAGQVVGVRRVRFKPTRSQPCKSELSSQLPPSRAYLAYDSSVYGFG